MLITFVLTVHFLDQSKTTELSSVTIVSWDGSLAGDRHEVAGLRAHLLSDTSLNAKCTFLPASLSSGVWAYSLDPRLHLHQLRKRYMQTTLHTHYRTADWTPLPWGPEPRPCPGVLLGPLASQLHKDTDSIGQSRHAVVRTRWRKLCSQYTPMASSTLESSQQVLNPRQ